MIAPLEFEANVLPFGIGLFLVLSIISWIDWHTLKIPNVLNVLLAVSGGLWIWSSVHGEDILLRVIGACLLALALLCVRYWYFSKHKHHGLGLGDVKMAGAAGLWISPVNFPFFIFVSSSVALVVTMMLNGSERQKAMAFGPFCHWGSMRLGCGRIGDGR